MKNTLITVLILLLCATMSHDSTAITQKAKKEKTTEQLTINKPSEEVKVAVDPLLVTVNGDTMNRIGQPLFVIFTIKNITNDDLRLKNVSINIDNMAKDRFANDSTQCILQQHGEVVLQKGMSLQQDCRFEMKALATGSSSMDFRNYLFAGDIRFVVAISVDTLGDFNYYPLVTVKANEVSIFLGGIFGALLLGLFVWAQQLVTEQAARDNWGKHLGYTALVSVRGGVMAIIALLIGKTTQGTGSPVSLTVIDFAGGVMIGIFSYPLASWMASTLKTQDVWKAKASSGPLTTTNLSH